MKKNQRIKGGSKKRPVIAFMTAAAAFLLVCTACTALDYMKYLKTRVETDLDAECVYQVYSEAEIAKDPGLKDVCLYHFPAAAGEKTRCVIYLPGGSYKTCNPYDVCVPAAAQAADMGCTAFVLTYRVGEHREDFMPVKDVAAGIGYLISHADELNIDMEDYMLTGFSAGGHLAGLFGSEDAGYGKYGVPRPGAIGLAYPLINVSQGFFETWNAVSDYVNYDLRSHAAAILIGDDAKQGERAVLDVHTHVTPDYPKVFLVQGDSDFLVRFKTNSELMAGALTENSVPFEYRLYDGLTHGFGIGTGTEAEGWNRDAILFWLEDDER